MYFDAHSHREVMRQRISEERRRIEDRRMARPSGANIALRARLSRFLVGAAFAVDPEEGWRAFWRRLSRSGDVARNTDI